MSVLNITLAFNDVEKVNKMLMVVSQNKQSFLHENNFSETIFMNSPVFESSYLNPLTGLRSNL